MPDGENDDLLGFIRVVDSVRKRVRKSASNAIGDLRRGCGPLRNTLQGLPNRCLEACGDSRRFAPVPRSGFGKLGARFRMNDDASFASAPKIFRSSDSHGSLFSGVAWCQSIRLLMY